MLKNNLFQEATIAINKQKVIAANPYVIGLSNKLTPLIPPINKGVADNITLVFGKQDNEGAFNDAASNDGFYSFVGTVKQAFQNAQPPILGRYEESEQQNEKPTDPPGKLAWLVGLAYYLEYVHTMKNKPKDNNFRATPNYKNAMRIAKKLVRRLVSLGLKTLDINAKFTSDMASAVCAVVWDKEKDEASKSKSSQKEPYAPKAEQPLQQPTPTPEPMPPVEPVQAAQQQQTTVPGQEQQMPLAAGRSYKNLRLKKPFGLLD